MTLKTKSFIFNISTTICAITFIIFLSIVSMVKELQDSPYIMLIIISGIVLATSIILQLFYKKALSTEIIFLTIFLLSIAMQNRIAIPLFEFNSYIVTLVISRISILFKYLGLLSLLGASLFSYSIKQQKIGSWLLLSIYSI
ncbi:MAG: hypothetical protein B6229_09480 [Spirochaetaceae bacterium 4572_7]|nr:MAG: hypothetical protein B6229_09480 [Spirochaetaceae bacterium 4572_7]